MADSDRILTNQPRSQLGVLVVAFLAPFVIITLGSWIWNLQTQVDHLKTQNTQLHESLQTQAECPMVNVVCECPEYDEGWDDAQYAEGCDPRASEMSIEDLQVMCAEIETYGYVPGC